MRIQHSHNRVNAMAVISCICKLNEIQVYTHLEQRETRRKKNENEHNDWEEWREEDEGRKNSANHSNQNYVAYKLQTKGELLLITKSIGRMGHGVSAGWNERRTCWKVLTMRHKIRPTTQQIFFFFFCSFRVPCVGFRFHRSHYF